MGLGKILTCEFCNQKVGKYPAKGRFSNYHDLGPTKLKCPHCQHTTPTGRKYWTQMSAGEKLIFYGKSLFRLPLWSAITLFFVKEIMQGDNLHGYYKRWERREEAWRRIIENPAEFALLAIVLGLMVVIIEARFLIHKGIPPSHSNPFLKK